MQGTSFTSTGCAQHGDRHLVMVALHLCLLGPARALRESALAQA